MSTSPSPVVPAYQIRALESEISYFDRQIAHTLKFETFASDAQRNAAASKLSEKRQRLVRTLSEILDPSLIPMPSPAKKATPRPRRAPASTLAPEQDGIAV